MVDLDAVIERIKGRITNFLTPGECWLWTGAHTVSGPRVQKMYDSARIPYYQPVNVRPFGLVRIEGKRWPVHKVVYEWSTPQIEKSPTYRLYNQCRDTLCCNPEHWLMRDREAEEAAKAASAAAPVDPELMLRRDCEELLEALLAVTQPRCFDDIQNHPYMMDFQPAVIKEVLRGIGKDHLCQ